MEENGTVTSAKSKAKQKFRNGTASISKKLGSLENKYEELRRKIRKKGADKEASKSSSGNESIASDSKEELPSNDTESVTKEDEEIESEPKQTISGEDPQPGREQMELYYFAPSPPCRAVMLFMHALSLDPIMKEVDISKGDNLKPEYAKLNPQRTIPVIVDNGFVLSESRAILGYLAEQYGGGNTNYYPNDPRARGVINQRLLFDIGTLYQRFLDLYMEMFFSDQPIGLNEEKVKKLREALEFLEIFMGDSEWMAGDEITIADYSLVVTVSTIKACGFDLTKYRRVTNWLQRCEREMINYEEVNQRGADIFGQFVKNKLKMSEL